ncbi:MAG: D-glycero-beta-D-manno-heptose-7-phosphate kinase [Marinilabiliales bacterium]
MTFEQINEIFKSFNDKNVMIIGDVMVDGYIWGKVERISPEAPVPVVSITKRENRLGGAANVALNVKAMGANPIICTVIGNDDKGAIFKELLKKRQLEDDCVVIDNSRKTTSKIRIISGDQHLLRVDDEHTEFISDNSREKLFDKILQAINTKQIHVVIFQDYDKGVINSKLISKVVKLANQKGIPVAVDPKKRNFNYYKDTTLFKPNFKELSDGTKTDLDKDDFDSLFKACKDLQNKINAKYIFVTLSESGVFITDGKKWHHHPAHVRDIADVSGAGDTVISIASLCLTTGMNISEIAVISNIAGGLVCEKVGVVPIDKNQLLEKLIRKDF